MAYDLRRGGEMTADGNLRPSYFVREPLLGQLVNRRHRSREEEAKFRKLRAAQSGLRDRMFGPHQANIPIPENVDADEILVGYGDRTNRQVDLTRTHRVHHAVVNQWNDLHANKGR